MTASLLPRPKAARRLVLPLLAAASALALGACVTVPDAGPRPQPMAADSLATQRSFQAPAADWPSDRWWEAYKDPQLTALIDEALKGSPTLAQAQARLRLAAAQAQQAKAAELPQVTFNGTVTETEQSKNLGYPPFIQQYLPSGFKDQGRITLDASYDLDLFGKNRAALAAAVSETEAAKADAAQARLTLSSAVAQAYGDLARLYAERDVAADTVRIRQETADLTSQRVQNGLDTRAELDQALAATPAAKADLESLDEQILIARHRLAVLLGEGPDRGLDISRPQPGAVKAFGLPENLTVNLLGRRPDIVAARLRVEEAGKRIDVAKADFYPDVSLTGFIGQQSLGIAQLTAAGSAIGQIGPAVRLPIFDGGRLRGAYRGARAQYDLAVADYDQTLTQALQDVADSAASAQSIQRQLVQRREALAASESAYKVARLRYEGGLSEYVAVLTAEDGLIQNRRALADLEARAFTLDVALVRALGGGFAKS
ncbi:efflux transporter outer membrane subunit [Caulobacter sp. KR2-114]|uniref:efflux transporter outer membrane subunit n=1 Tax=Caulobacter sp. KR2-114 TaxID=3400912 RepID=UPI003C0356AF